MVLVIAGIHRKKWGAPDTIKYVDKEKRKCEYVSFTFLIVISLKVGRFYTATIIILYFEFITYSIYENYRTEEEGKWRKLLYFTIMKSVLTRVCCDDLRCIL
jgi:hypothetical protein